MSREHMMPIVLDFTLQDLIFRLNQLICTQKVQRREREPFPCPYPPPPLAPPPKAGVTSVLFTEHR